MAETTGSPIKTFIRQSLKEIQDALPKDFDVMGNINYDLSVVTTKSKRGKADIRVLSLGGQVDVRNIQRISFAVGNPKKNKETAIEGIKNLKEMFFAFDEKPKRKKTSKKKR